MFTNNTLRAALNFAQTENPKNPNQNSGTISKELQKRAMSFGWFNVAKRRPVMVSNASLKDFKRKKNQH